MFFADTANVESLVDVSDDTAPTVEEASTANAARQREVRVLLEACLSPEQLAAALPELDAMVAVCDECGLPFAMLAGLHAPVRCLGGLVSCK